MPLDRRRRLFRAAPRSSVAVNRPALPRSLAAGLMGVLTGAALMLLIEPGDLFGRAPPLGGEVTALPAQTAVVDGETLLLRDSVVRLLGVAAPSRGQLCRHSDHSSFDCGAAAAAALENLVREQKVICQLHGRDAMGRALAVCEAAGRELNHALVAGGWAHARSELVGLGDDEAAARRQHLGFWSGEFDPRS